MGQRNFPIEANPIQGYTDDEVYFWMGHRFRERAPNSPTENFALDRGSATMQMAIDWDKRRDFVPDVLGYTEVLRLDGNIVAPRVNETQVVDLASGTATGGTFTLEYAGQLTNNISFNATADDVETELAALANIGQGNVSVQGGPLSTGYTVVFQNALGGQDLPRMTADGSSLTGSSPVIQVTTLYDGGTEARSTRYLSRRVPMPYPAYRTTRDIGRYYMFADSVQYNPDTIVTGDTQFGSAYQDGVPQKLALYAEAYGTIGFSSRDYVIMDDDEMTTRQADNGLYPDIASVVPLEYTLLRYVTGSMRPRAHYQSIPQFSVLKWNVDDAAMDNKSVVIIVEGDVQITWHQVPIEAYPKTAIDRLMGRTNLYPFGAREGPLYNLLGTFGPGQLVCLAPTTKQYRMPNGEFALDITYNFQYFPRGSNTFYRVNLENQQIGWERASRDGNSFLDETVTYLDIANGVNPLFGDPAALLYYPDNFDALFTPEPG